MQLVADQVQETSDPSFTRTVKEQSHAGIERCYQCLTCTLGCPVASAMDYPPHEIVRMVQLGLKDRVLKSSTIWICASCLCCVTRCPNEIDIPHVMDTLHQMALREGVAPKEPAVAAFHEAFLSPIKRFGRQYEVMMTVGYMLKAKKFSLGDLIGNALLGYKMLTKGKLKLQPPHSIKGTEEVKHIFERSERGGE
ncbi:MAG: 4Fe-4S dicluster domain-containing protein [Chloroflexota bacterium]|nr:4Fe-4S dicluster domain-containing protein [Chloroflexota bacterium]